MPVVAPTVVVSVSRDIPALVDKLKKMFHITGWWWLIKFDSEGLAVRLRIGTLQEDRLPLLAAVTDDKGIYSGAISTLKYEPEMHLFGGVRGISLAHRIFTVDSEFIAQWRRDTQKMKPPLIPPSISVVSLMCLLRAAKLDLFECWDVFERVAYKRQRNAAVKGIQCEVDAWLEKVARIDRCALERMIDDDNLPSIKRYLDELEKCGSDITRTYFQGGLNCGPREFLVPVILFHWNRIRLGFTLQSAIAHAVAGYLRAQSRDGGGVI